MQRKSLPLASTFFLTAPNSIMGKSRLPQSCIRLGGGKEGFQICDYFILSGARTEALKGFFSRSGLIFVC